MHIHRRCRPITTVQLAVLVCYHCERGIAKQYYDDIAFERKHEVFGSLPSETPSLIDIKYCTIDYVRQITQYAKNSSSRFRVAGSPHASTIRFWDTVQ